MANPQLENGYTRIANELLEALARKELSGRGFRCLVAIIRETFGWNRKEAVISGYKLAEMTGIAAPHVHKVLKELEVIGIIEKESHPKGSTIRLKKDYEKWVSSTKKSNTLEGNTLEGNTLEGNTVEGTGSNTLEGNTGNTLEGNTAYPTGLVAERIPGGAKERKEKKEIKEKEKLLMPSIEVEIPENLKTDEFLEAWAEWKTHLSEKKAKTTPSAFRRQLKTLEEWGTRKAIFALNKSITNNWQGVFDPKDYKPPAEANCKSEFDPGQRRGTWTPEY